MKKILAVLGVIMLFFIATVLLTDGFEIGEKAANVCSNNQIAQIINDKWQCKYLITNNQSNLTATKITTTNITGNPVLWDNATLREGLQFQTNYSTRPACDSTTRGKVWFSFGGVGVKDTIDVCEKSALDIYAWIGIG